MCDIIMKNSMKKFISLCVLLSTVGLKVFASAASFPRSAPIPIRKIVQDDREELNIKSIEDDHFSVSKKFDLSHFTPLVGSWTDPDEVKLRSDVSVSDTSTNNSDRSSQQSGGSLNSEFETDDEPIRPYKRLEVPLNSGFKSSLPKNSSGYFEGLSPRDNFQPVSGSWVNPAADFIDELVHVIRFDGSVNCPCPLPLAPVHDYVKLMAKKIEESQLSEYSAISKNKVLEFVSSHLNSDSEILQIFKTFNGNKESIQFFIDAIVRYMTLNPKQ